ncbi:tetratricopeptide repeat protein [Calothrix sp. NIES-2098]|uniref:tetratricopeptide repeat protein n=1 Tax=Calothrix sp. NIES-2098 TaxID=1954171 RepID=UPI000B61DF44|nr:family 2 glycosyl transferase [Calothrix sp. NIES-2098]
MSTLQPQSAAVYNNLGYTLQQQGKLDEAVACYQRALEIQPKYTEAEVNLGNILHRQGKLTTEQQAYYAALNHRLGIACKKAGDLKTAVTYYQQAIALQPDLAEAHYNLGDVLQQQGQVDAAQKSYLQAIKYNPDNAYAYNNLGAILEQKGQLAKAVKSYQQALKLKPNLAIIHNNLGNVLKSLGRFEAAVESYQQALKLNQYLAQVHYNLANTFKKLNKLEAAAASYKQALKIKPDFDYAKFGLVMSQIPIIYTSSEEIQVKRNLYQQALQNLAAKYQADNQKKRANAATAIGSLQPFYLAYQGLNDRDLQCIYGEMICQIMSSRYPQWSQPIELPKLKVNEKIRIGFVSGFFSNHSNWKIPIKGWVENLDKSEFELFGYHTGAKHDRETKIAAKAFDKFTQGPLVFEKWCELIQQDKLHILIFPEFGMDPITMKLGCLKLAPIQMTSWGHPNTSGLPTIDYYLSSDLMEPENGQEYYTEKLVRLPNLSIYYTPLAIQPKTVTKKDIGIEDNEIMFWCCQSLYKYLPQHDDIFPRIAQNLKNCKFVFIKHESQYVNEVFSQRLNSAFAELGLHYQDYCIFLPRLNAATFAGTAAMADVFLDSMGWSGCNSSLEAIAHNIPTLTLPGDSMRGRHTLAILKMMGVEETIATNKEEYVNIAVRLGQDAEYRQHISQQVAQNKHKLYDDVKLMRALEDFLFQVVNKPRRFAQREIAEIFQLAVQHQRANRFAEAENLYRQILEKQPEHAEALYGLGMLAQQMGQLQTAEQCLSTATQVQPDSVKIWFSLGNLHQAQGQLTAAEVAYQCAIALRPDAVPIYNNLGYTLEQQGKFDEAVACYQKALEIQPNCVEAEANLGNTLYAQKKLSVEQQLYYSVLNRRLGMSRQKVGDLKTALAYYRQAIALHPDLADTNYNLDEGNLEEAIADYQKVLEINTHDRESGLNLGKIHQQQVSI